MKNFQAVYYRDSKGNQPVKDFIRHLDSKQRVAVVRQIEMLNMLSDSQPNLPFPYSSQIEGELRELRCHYGTVLYRILYQRSKRLVVLLHAFEKKTKQVPRSEIQIAKKRMRDFTERMDSEKRKPPRAVGGDAP